MTAASHLSAIVPEIWSARYFEVLLAELPFSSLVSTDYQGEISDLGDTVNISSFPEFAEGDVLAEDARQDAVAVTIAGQQLVIDTQIVRDFIVTRKATLQSLPHMDKLKEMAVYAVLKKFENVIIAATIPSAAAPDHQIAYASPGVLGLADILAAKELLDLQNVPASDRHMVLGASAMNDIFNITGFTSSDFLLAGAPLQTGQVPAALLGFLPHMTTLVSATSYFFHKSYMTVAAQKGIEVKEYDLGVDGYRGTRVNVTTLMGKKQLDNKRVVSIA